MFYVIIFFILFIREFLYIFLTIFSGILAIYYPEDDTIKSKTYAKTIYEFSTYLVEGLFMAAILILFWVLRTTYRSGQVISTSQILLLNQSNEGLIIMRDRRGKR